MICIQVASTPDIRGVEVMPSGRILVFTNDGCIGLDVSDAVKLRDALSRAITETATAAAKAVEGEAA